MPRFVASAP